MNSNRQLERGVVSIFVVIFTALLITIVTTSFLQIMLRNQQQASNNDLSQSAYDSALAGVEDAKRALIKLKECKDDTTSSFCSNLRSTLINNGSECNVLDQAGIRTFTNGEVAVGDPTLNQAYSCVKINVNTDSYQGVLDANGAVLIPLQSVVDTNDITAVRISWFMQDDNPGNMPQFPLPVQLLSSVGLLGWKSQYPSLMRSQLIQFQKGAVNLSDFDTAGNKNANTLFLYPNEFGSATYNFSDDVRLSGANSPLTTQCVAAYTLNGGYACSVDIALPSLGAGTREAYLHLTSLYNASHYKVQLLGISGGVVDFDNVQPEVDATGRASDLFRRVKARVAVSGGIPQTYPDAISLGKSLCKDFFITNDYYEDDTNHEECRAEQ